MKNGRGRGLTYEDRGHLAAGRAVGLIDRHARTETMLMGKVLKRMIKRGEITPADTPEARQAISRLKHGRDYGKAIRQRRKEREQGNE